MKKTASWITSGIAVAGLIIVFSSLSQSQEIFPAGPGKDTLLLVCIQCHSLNRITESNLSASDWEFTLYDMISRGAPVRRENIDPLKKYLVDNFATEDK